MSTIYKVNNNIRHNQDTFEAGMLVEAEVFGDNVADLLNDGAIVEVVGANTVEEAADLLSKQEEQSALDAEVAAQNAPKNTWEAQPDEQPSAPETPATEDATPASTENAPATDPALGDANTPSTDEETGDNL